VIWGGRRGEERRGEERRREGGCKDGKRDEETKGIE
jgi:hypothetical protein